MDDLAPPAADNTSVAVYELPPDGGDAQPVADDREQDAQRNRKLLLQNATWFCQLRWIVAGVLALAGLAACLPFWTARLGVQLAPAWLLASAAVLAVANTGFVLALKRLRLDSSAGSLRVYLWCQIVLDLAVLTAVVHSLGSYLTYAPVAYLFHIVLACIFFPRWESLGVTIVSAVLFGSLVLLETAGVLHRPTALFDAAAGTSAHRGCEKMGLAPSGNGENPRKSAVAKVPVPIFSQPHSGWLWQLTSLLGIWAVIWYLTSRLAAELRRRKRELAAANRRLQASSAERASHMLQTTHQLKAPFAAIHANTQLLLKGYTGPLSDPSRAVIERIAARAQMLSQQIQQMLQLANLRSQSQAEPTLRVLDLQTMIRREVERIEPQAALRGISLETELEEVLVRGSDDYLVMLIDNLLNNAINYSFDGGRVAVACGRRDRTTACMVVRDHGIGIPAEKLPRVFQDYYRTTEAAQHHKASTGLGLAIVRLVANALQATVRIESSPGWGTRVTLLMPAVVEEASSE